jgi:cytochrome c biogenesis protein CcdA/thiol-disulfide isomerase/thioredoxin
MLRLLLAYAGGVLTIVSPCILPVLPFVFARADRPFRRSGLPLLIGMAGTFALVATLAAVGAGWAVAANHWGRVAALALLALFGLTLLVPSLAERLSRPLVAWGARLDQRAASEGSEVARSLLLGVATGLLWAPCAGPILGLILTGAAIGGATVGTTLMLLAYAAGAATSLALALLVGGRVFAAMKRALGVGEWIRRALGVAVLVGVAAIALGMDTGLLTRLSLSGTNSIEQSLLDRLPGQHPAMMAASEPGGVLPVEGTMPSLAGAVDWLNSPPLTAAGLRGKVVLVDFWTYSCINCLRTIPYVRAWADKYRESGLVVIGVHTPEFAFEKDLANIRQAVATLHIDYPVANDSNYAIWKGFDNEYWPADYFVDANGKIRHHQFGEGDYAEAERVIQQLLREAGHMAPAGIVQVAGQGAEAAADDADVDSQETYIGYGRGQNMVSPGGTVEDAAHDYTPGTPKLNQWGLSGNWTVSSEHATLNAPGGSIVYRFHARDLHLVLGPAADGKPIGFHVLIDGQAPGASHGADVGADGGGTIATQRLYQLVRQAAPITDHTFEIRFDAAGVQAYAFTFG